MTINELKDIIRKNELTIQRYLGKDIILKYWSKLNSCKITTFNVDITKVINEHIAPISDISDLVKDLYRDWPKFKLTQSVIIRSFAVLIRLTTEMKLHQLADVIITCYGLYTHFMILRRYLKFCDEHVYTLTLETLPGQHLFKVKNGIPDALSYIVLSIYSTWKTKIVDTNNSKTMIRLLYDIRSRWEQSVKSAMIRYYKIKNGEIDIVHIGRSSDEREYAIDDRFDSIISNFINRTIVYKSINMNLVDKISVNLKFKKNYFYPLLEILTKITEDELRILCYMIIDNESYDTFISKNYIKTLLKKLSTKKTKDRSSLKERLDDFILNNSNQFDQNFLKLYSKLSLPYKQKIRVALVYYIYHSIV